jgi:hypothetical protein
VANEEKVCSPFCTYQKFHGLSGQYHIHKSPPSVAILSQLNLVHTLPPYFFRIHSNIVPLPVPVFQAVSTLQAFSLKCCMQHSSFSSLQHVGRVCPSKCFFTGHWVLCPGCMVDKQDIPSETAPGVILWQRLYWCRHCHVGFLLLWVSYGVSPRCLSVVL